jgi:hypothetical protein
VDFSWGLGSISRVTEDAIAEWITEVIIRIFGIFLFFGKAR